MKKNQHGVVLVFTLVMMSLLLSAALVFGYMIISDLKQANQVDESIIAYYAADAGLEQSLYRLRKGDFEDASSLLLVSPSGALSWSDSAWNISASTDYEKRFLRQRLYSGQGIKLYFLGRNGTPRTNLAEKIGVVWYKGIKDDLSFSNIRLKATFTQLNPQVNDENILVYYTDQSPAPLFSDYNATGQPDEFDFLDSTINGCASGCDGPYDYVVELTALGSEDDDFIDSIAVTAYDGDDNIVDEGITNLTIKSQGQKGDSFQEIIAHLPPRDPVSGLLGFVLFSEQDIEKGY